MPTKITKEAFGKTHAGVPVEKYTLRNARGAAADILTYGAAIRAFRLEDGADIVLGYDTLSDYERGDKYMGAVCGRFANRIGEGVFTLNGADYRLAVNNGPNHLHGGVHGFDKKIWRAKADDAGVLLSCESADGEEGYPGNLTVSLRYTLTEDNALTLVYEAKSDRDTVINLTNHAYWNLAGQGSGSVLGQTLRVRAERYTENDDDCLPTGNIFPVAGTPFDFRTEVPLGARIDAPQAQLRSARGYDLNYVLDRELSGPACVLRDEEKKRALEVYTDQPGIQVYTGNFLDEKVPGKSGERYAPYSGIALETQGFPNAPRISAFPTAVLRAGEVYRTYTIYQVLEDRHA